MIYAAVQVEGRVAVLVDLAICDEWSQRHVLSASSLHWVVEHADPGDLTPIITAISLLRSLPGSAIYAAPMTDIANDNGAPAWAEVLRSQVTGEDVAPDPEPEPEAAPEQTQ